MSFPPPRRFSNINLAQAEPTKATPDLLRSQLQRVGLACDEITDSLLNGSIATIRSGLPTNTRPNQAYLIGEPVTEADFSSGRVVAGVRDLLPSVQAAALPARLLVGFMASTNSGTRQFVDQLFAGDETAQDLREQVSGSHRTAETFVSRIANAPESDFLAIVEELESPAVRYLATLADTGLQPTAVGTWTPTAGGVYGEAQLTTMYKHWDRMKQNMGSDFVGVDNTWPSTWESCDNNEAFEQLFLRISIQATAALVAGLDKSDMEAMLANRVGENAGHDPNDYDSGPRTMTVFLVGDYDPVTQDSAGLGFLTINYRNLIRDFRDKSKDAHDPNAKIDGLCRACMFTDLTIFDNHAAAAAG